MHWMVVRVSHAWQLIPLSPSNAGLLYDVSPFICLLLFSLLLLSLFSNNDCSWGFSFTTTVYTPPQDLIPPELGNKHPLIATSKRNICRIFSSENCCFTSYLEVTIHSKLTVKLLSLERFLHDCEHYMCSEFWAVLLWRHMDRIICWIIYFSLELNFLSW